MNTRQKASKMIAIMLALTLLVVGIATLIGCSPKSSGDPYNAILANNDSMAKGAADGLKEDLAKQIPIFGVDALPEAVEYVNRGVMAGTVRQRGDEMARATIDLAARFLASGSSSLTDTFKETNWYLDDKYQDKNLDVVEDSLDYTAKENIVRIPYEQFSKGDTIGGAENLEVQWNKDDLAGKKITFFTFDISNDYMTSVYTAMRDYYDVAGFDVAWTDPQDGADGGNDQIAQLESVLAASDLIVMNPNSVGDTKKMLEMATDAGVKMIFINKQDPQFDYASVDSVYIGSDLDGGGAMQGQMLAQILSDGGLFDIQRDDNSEVHVRVLILLGDSGHPDAIYRSLTWIGAAREALEGTGIIIDYNASLPVANNPDIQPMPSGQNWTAEGASAVVESFRVSPGFKNPKDL